MSIGPTGPDGRLSNFGRFDNCTFTGNVAREYGAAIGAITLLYFQDMVNLLPLEVESWLALNFCHLCTLTLMPIFVHYSTFIGNDDGGGGGVLSTAYLPLRFSGHSVFTLNRGRTLVVNCLLYQFLNFWFGVINLCFYVQVIGAYVEIQGGMHFDDNNGANIDGGAMYITSLGQLELFKGANISFTGNTGV